MIEGVFEGPVKGGIEKAIVVDKLEGHKLEGYVVVLEGCPIVISLDCCFDVVTVATGNGDRTEERVGALGGVM